MSEHVYSAKWPERQRAAEQAWRAILKLVKDQKELSPVRELDSRALFYAFTSVTLKQYGYCAEFFDFYAEDGACAGCPLYDDAFCTHHCNDGTTVVWTLIKTIREDNSDWDLAKRLALRMLERVRKDMPSAQANSPFAKIIGESS